MNRSRNLPNAATVRVCLPPFPFVICAAPRVKRRERGGMDVPRHARSNPARRRAKETPKIEVVVCCQARESVRGAAAICGGRYSRQTGARAKYRKVRREREEGGGAGRWCAVRGWQRCANMPHDCAVWTKSAFATPVAHVPCLRPGNCCLLERCHDPTPTRRSCFTSGVE